MKISTLLAGHHTLFQIYRSCLIKRWLPLLIIVLVVVIVPFAQPVKAVLPNGYPETLAIFYGDPAAVNGSAGNPTLASGTFDDYNMVIFGEGIEQETHAYHTTTQTIIQNIQSTTRAYGYLDLCVQNPNSSLYRCSNFSMSELQSRTDKWKNMGAAGVFLDQAGCEYVVSRHRLNTIVDYIHAQGMSAFVNVWNLPEAFEPGSVPSPYEGYADCNPNHLPTHLGSNDYALLESWAVVLSDWSENWTVDPDSMLRRGEQMIRYKNQYGIKAATVNTIGYNNPPFEQNKFEYVWWTSLLYGFDAMGWGETWVYSADTNALPFHPRLNPGDIGDTILPLVVSDNGTSRTRSTSAGYISVDLTSHTGQFVYDGTPPPSLTPSNTPTPTNTSIPTRITQSGTASTDIISGSTTFDGNNVTFTLQTNDAPWEYFSLFVDTDNNPGTGYTPSNSVTGQSFTLIGAEKLVQNGFIYDWAGGADQTAWSWSYTGQSDLLSGTGTSQITVRLTYTQLGYTPATLIGILAQHMSTGYATYDFLYRDPAQVWKASSQGSIMRTPTATPSPADPPVVSSITQSGSNENDIIAGNIAFDGSRVSFTLDLNGGAWQYFRIFVDTDNDPATGYKRVNGSQVYSGIGAEKLIENGYVYNWAGGTGQTAWSWSFTGNSVTGTGTDSSQLSLSLTYSQLGYIPSTFIGILVEHVSTAYVTYDFLYRDPAQVWKASSQASPTSTPTLIPTNTAQPTVAVPTNTPAVSTPTPLPTNLPGRIRPRLNLSALCSPAPNLYRVWSVHNKTNTPIIFAWTLLGTQQSGTQLVPVQQSITFQTVREQRYNIMIIRVNGEIHDIALSNTTQCSYMR